MIIEIKKPVTKKKVADALARTAGTKKKKSLRKHFGQLKRGLDGITYQKKTGMSGLDFVADTNFLISLHEGK